MSVLPGVLHVKTLKVVLPVIVEVAVVAKITPSGTVSLNVPPEFFQYPLTVSGLPASVVVPDAISILLNANPAELTVMGWPGSGTENECGSG